MPVQHASNRLLKRMRRAITRERTEDLFARIREEVPGIAIRSTVLVGHPGETEEDHEELLVFLERTRMDRVGTFVYSHEENTHSYSFEDDVPAETKQKRFDDVMTLQQAISLELNTAKVGETLRVLVDRPGENGFVGRTEFDSPEVDNEVLVRTGQLTVGEFYDVRIDKAEPYDLEGRVSR
jgi:ribosomal protein S12 methylthiotransferase